MTSRRTSRVLKALLGLVLSALIAAEPVLAGASQGAVWAQRQAALRERAARPALATAAPRDSSVEDILAAAPGRLATPPGRTSARTLVLIQDVHMNAEAQTNIRRTVEALAASGRVSFVALEGASGPIDLSIRDRGVAPDILHGAADYLSRTGRLSGAAHALLTGPTSAVRAHGVERLALYEANVRSAAKGRALLPGAERQLAELQRVLDRAETDSFRPELKTLARSLRAAKKMGGMTPAYAEVLLTEGPRANAPHLRRYAEAARLESAFDAHRLERERRRLMDALLPALSDVERTGLLAMAMSYRAGRASQSDLFREIDRLGRAHEMASVEMAALRAHLRYLDLADAIDVSELSTEAARLERSALDALATSGDERRVLNAGRWLASAGRLVRFGMTSDEWQAYDDARSQMPDLFTNDAPDLAPFEEFYRIATARDEALAAEVEKLFAESEGVGVLVAGGFHSEGLARAFAAHGPRVLTFTPRLTRDPGDADAYFSVFTREKTPLDRLLDGEKLFLASPPARLGILPELILLGEEAAHPRLSLPDPARRLAVLRGGAAGGPVISRDRWPRGAEITSDAGTFAAAYNDKGALLELSWMEKRPEDFEFLETFRPLQFLRAHTGTPAQQALRAIGIFAMWSAMLAAPVAAAYFLPGDAFRAGVALVGYLSIAGAARASLIDSHRQLSPREKVLYVFAYAPNVVTHGAYNFLFGWYAPLTADETAFRAWAATVQGQSVATTKAELMTAFGLTDYGVRQLLKEYSITAGAKQKSDGRKDLEAWTAARRGKKIIDTTEALAARFKISASLVLIVLADHDIEPVGKQTSRGRVTVEAWTKKNRGRTITGSRIQLVTRFRTNLTTLAAALKEFGIKVISPGVAAARRRRKAFETWASDRAGQTIAVSATTLAEERRIAYRHIKAALDRHNVTAVPAPASAATPKPRPRRVESSGSLGAFLQPYEGRELRRTPAWLAAKFGVEIHLVRAILTSLNIRAAGEASLMTPATEARFAAEGRGNPRGARARLMYAPDREFLQTFAPLAFLRAHKGTALQQSARALGIGAIWLAMIGTPLVAAYFLPPGLDVVVIGFGALQFGLTFALARLDASLRLPVEIKAGLFLIYLPNLAAHALYNLVAWFAPLTFSDEGRAALIRETVEGQLTRLRRAFIRDPVGEERAQRTLAHLWLSPIGDDPASLSRWAISFRHAVGEVIAGDVAFTDLRNLQQIRLTAREELDDDYLRSTFQMRRGPPEPMRSAEEAVYVVNPVKEGVAINMANSARGDANAITLIYEVIGDVMFIVELQKRGGGAAIAPLVTERLLDKTIESARVAGLSAVRLPVAGDIVDQFLSIPPTAAHGNYARLPFQKGFRLQMRDPVETQWGLGQRTAPLIWELPLISATTETTEARIERELAELTGLFYYPAGGSDWKPFRHFLTRMPLVTTAFYADREYAGYFEHLPYYKEDRARRLIEQQGLTVQELPGPRNPDHISVSDETGRAWRVEFYPGDVIANALNQIASARRVSRFGGVGYIHIERPGEGAALAVGRNSGPFHGKLIEQLRVGGILGGYRRPAEEPFEFLQDHYDLVGIERLGNDAAGNLFLKKTRQVDAAVIARLIQLDRDLRDLYRRVEYPYGTGWSNYHHQELIGALARMKGEGLEPAAAAVRARFEEKFAVQVKIHNLNPDTVVIPMARMTLFTLVLTIGQQSGLLWEESLFRVGAGLIALFELSVLLAGVLVKRARTRAGDWDRSAALEARARVLVRAAKALSEPNATVTDDLIQAATADAAQSLGVSAGNAEAHRLTARFDWATSLADDNFPAVLDRVIREEAARGLDVDAASALVVTLSGWGVPVDTDTLVRSNIVVKVRSRADLARVSDIERRLPGANLLIWADRATAAGLSDGAVRWPVVAHADDVFNAGALSLKNAAASLPAEFRDAPENLVFVLPNGISVDASGLPEDSAWRNVRLLFIDQILGLLRVLTLRQKNVIDQVVEHLVTARQA